MRYEGRCPESDAIWVLNVLIIFWMILTWLLSRYWLNSNYLGCWIFEISSSPDLEYFSILFFVFLSIRSVEFDDSQNLRLFWVAWGLSTLRLTRLWIYIWVFVKLDIIIWLKNLNFFMKKWIFPNRSRINLGWFLDHQGMKKHQFESIGSFRNHEKTSKFWKSDKLKNWSRKWQDTIARSWSRSFSPFYGGSNKKNIIKIRPLDAKNGLKQDFIQTCVVQCCTVLCCGAVVCCAVLG